MISIARPVFGLEEEAAIQRVLPSGQLAQGEHVAAFERRFADVCQVREAVALSSGTAALHIALLAHDIGPGDEVITTAFSFAATTNVILHVYHQYTLQVPEQRAEWVGQLRSRGIGTGVHYPLPIHQQPFYQERSDEFRFVSSEQSAHTKNTATDGRLPVTELAAQQVLSLPVHPALS